MVEFAFYGIQYDDDEEDEDEDEDDYGIMFQFLTALTVLSKMTLKKREREGQKNRQTDKVTERKRGCLKNSQLSDSIHLFWQYEGSGVVLTYETFY